MPSIPIRMINPGTHVVVPSGRKPLNSVGGRRLRRGQAVGLVMDVGVAFEGGRVLAAVVGAEEQFTTTVEAGPHEGLGPTPVASVGSGQARCQCSVQGAV